MSERLIWQGQKQEKELAAKQLEISISGIRDSLRVVLNPHAAVAEMDPEVLWSQAFELADKLTRYKGLLSQIRNINRSLGIK